MNPQEYALVVKLLEEWTGRPYVSLMVGMCEKSLHCCRIAGHLGPCFPTPPPEGSP